MVGVNDHWDLVKRGRGQGLQGLVSHLEDIGREMKRTGVIVQQVPNSDELLLDVPRIKREKVLFSDVISSVPQVTSPEQLYFPLGRTPNGRDLIEDLSQMPHMLVGGSTGSGKSVFLFTMLASLLMTHPKKEDIFAYVKILKKPGGNTMLFLSTVLSAATLGATLGSAIATISGTSVAAGTAIGTLAGATAGVAIAVGEELEYA